MSQQLFTNNAVTLLAAPVQATDTTLSVLAGAGDLFPTITGADQFFLVTLENEGATSREIVKVTGRVGDVFTGLVRGWEATSPQAWSAGVGGDTLVDHRITAGTLADFIRDTNFGQSTKTLDVQVAETETVNVLDITSSNRTCKWIVTIQTEDERIAMCEILGVYKSTGPIHNIYAKVGDTVRFKVHVTGTSTDMSLSIENTDTSTFTSVDVLRLQHYA